MTTILDIETEGLPPSQIVHLEPAFAAPSNYKDPAKIAESITEQRKTWYEKTALDPMTGRILVIGMKPMCKAAIVLEGDEKKMLTDFWQAVGYDSPYEKWVGHGIHGFDLPFLIKRSWLHGVKVPFATIMSDSGYVNNRRFVDTMVVLQCGDRKAPFTSLDKASKFFGLEGKLGDIGPMFGAVYAADRQKAIDYHLRDLEMIEGIALKMGVAEIPKP